MTTIAERRGLTPPNLRQFSPCRANDSSTGYTVQMLEVRSPHSSCHIHVSQLTQSTLPKGNSVTGGVI